MPSRPGVGFILLFWLGTTGYVVHREVLPHYFSDEPPAVHIELADEATPALPAKWSIYRNGKKIGGLETQLRHVPRKGSFVFESEYRDFKLDQGPISLRTDKFHSTLWVTRAGRMQAQGMSGTVTVWHATPNEPVKIGTATLDVSAKVVNDELVGRVKLTHPFGELNRPLTPVPVAKGQVLTPLLPVGRLDGVRPGRRWVIEESDPLRDSLGLLLKEAADKYGGRLLPIPAGERRAVIAAVRSESEMITPLTLKNMAPQPPAACWVVDYRVPGEGGGLTSWVAVDDGRVLRQEANLLGDKLLFERDY